MINWQLGAAQFGALWYGTGLDRYPFPFDIVSGFEWQDDADQFERAVREAFAGPEHERLRAAVRVLTKPDVHFAVTGRTVDETPIRVIAAQAQHLAAIAVQQPGPDENHGGDITLGFGSAGYLPGQIVAVLPPNSAGHNEFRRSTMTHDDEPRGFLSSAIATRTAPRLEQALTDRHAGNGAIRVWAGPRYGRQAEIGSLRWIDIAGDGRYVIGPRDRDRAIPADPAGLTRILEGMLELGLEEVREPQY
ncbi:ESX secretion-associated protein EspG [Aldersonia kunmingensis]|uniref:ESX secretion-associated protein EspG n=1 Tax=Aldersonia kunmingensis TaxID=408066 RepID=UPI00082A1CD8|nr:ESX secretion-associated protein EspG [Aldersonia kunmingensis]